MSGANANHGVLAHQVFVNIALDPPNGVGDQANPFVGVELFYRMHQAHIAFLDEIDQFVAELRILSGHLNHKAEVGGYKNLGILGVAFFFIALGDLALLFSGQERIFGNGRHIIGETIAKSRQLLRA